MASILTGHVTHWACLGCSGSAYTIACSSSCQYPATSQPLKRSGPTFHNQQPDQLYVKEMCCTAWGKWWSHQILTGFRFSRHQYDLGSTNDMSWGLFIKKKIGGGGDCNCIIVFYIKIVILKCFYFVCRAAQFGPKKLFYIIIIVIIIIIIVI